MQSGVWPSRHSGLTISTVDILVWPSRHKPNARWSMRISQWLLENHAFSAEGRIWTDGIGWKGRQRTNCKLVSVPLMLMSCSLLWHRVSNIIWRSIPIQYYDGLCLPGLLALDTDLKWRMAGCLFRVVVLDRWRFGMRSCHPFLPPSSRWFPQPQDMDLEHLDIAGKSPVRTVMINSCTIVDGRNHDLRMYKTLKLMG